MDQIAKDFWKDDLLGRKDEAKFLSQLVDARRADAQKLNVPFTLVVNVDADWGYGKTFTVDAWSRELSSNGHLVARIDAWASDFAPDPLVPVMAALEETLRPHMAERSTARMWQAAKENVGPILLATGGGLVRGLANRFIPGTAEAVGDMLGADVGDNIEGAVDDAMTDGAKKTIETLLDNFATRAITEFERTARSIRSFRSHLGDVLAAAANNDVPKPMYVFIDELDRCRPTYAVAMLERIKHLFQIPDVVFVVSTNTRQLQHSIASLYGGGLDSARYLHRFFDITYSLAQPSREMFVDAVLAQYPRLAGTSVMPRVGMGEYLVQAFGAYDMGARDMQQVMALLNAILSVWPDNDRPLYPVLVPLILAQQLRLTLDSLEDAAKLLEKNIKSRVWQKPIFRNSTGDAQNAGVLTVLQRTSELLKIGLQELNKSYPNSGMDDWILEHLFESSSGGQFSIESYIQRVRQVGRLFTKR